MPISSRSNNWASKLVIVLQFTAWISVGIVLLQKGVTSLRSQSAIENKGILQASNDATIRYSNEKTKRTVEQLYHPVNYNGERLVENLKIYPSEKHWSRRSSVDEDGDNNERNTSNEESEAKKKRKKKVEILNLNDTNIHENAQDASILSNQTREKDNVLDHAKERQNLSTFTGWNEERKLRRRLNTGGAAAAIAMVAVGAAMLVVGPIVIVLRALDKRRQERRYLKSCKWDDQPPSYEQATLMNEAPRYSTLNLNAVHVSRVSTLPSRPSSTPFERSPPG